MCAFVHNLNKHKSGTYILPQKLHHENLVSMIEVFRRKKRLYLVFEYLDHNVLDELENAGGGLDWERSRRHIFQILRGLDFCHNHKVSKKLRAKLYFVIVCTKENISS